MVVTSFLLLSCLGLSITAQAQDCTTPVGGPNMSLKDADILLEQFPEGSQVSFVCDVGYTSAGGSRTITCTAGGWSRLAMRCQRKNCGAFEEVENGIIDDSEGTEFGDKIVITCKNGYSLVGRGEIFCEDGGWNRRKPTCEVVTCDPPAQVEFGSFSPEAETYSYRDVVEYSCQKEFRLNGSKSVSCSADGTFQPAPPTCLRKNCSAFEKVENGIIDYSEGTEFGAKIVITCKNGYRLVGRGEIFCENSGWSGRKPTCEVVTCDPPAQIDLGFFSPEAETYSYSDVVEYSCEEEEFRLNGSKSVSCSADGTFQPAPPTCLKVTCAPPAKVENGSFSPDKESYHYKDVVQFDCQEYFILNGSKSVTCTKDDTFQPDPPTCIWVQCEDLVIENGSWVSGSQPPYGHKAKVTYKCNPGFKMIGEQTIVCERDSQWSPKPPTCERQD